MGSQHAAKYLKQFVSEPCQPARHRLCAPGLRAVRLAAARQQLPGVQSPSRPSDVKAPGVTQPTARLAGIAAQEQQAAAIGQAAQGQTRTASNSKVYMKVG